MATYRTLKSGHINVQIRRKNLKPFSKTFLSMEEAEAWALGMEQQVERGIIPNPKLHTTPEPKPLSFSNGEYAFAALGRRYCHTQLKDRPSCIPELPKSLRRALTKLRS
tara:strand:- start:343 stop:669 length:327 start_codon:yes stop_codon:yes gene_type:complete